MAKKKQIALRKQELIAQLADSRVVIDEGRAALKDKLNVKKQVQGLMKRKPKQLLIGSAVTGLAATLFLRRPKKKKSSKVRKSLGKVIFGWLLLALKPAAKKWLINVAKKTAIAQVNSLTKSRQPQNRQLEQNGFETARRPR